MSLVRRTHHAIFALAIVPLGAPLAASGNLAGAAAWGMTAVFAADHVIRPRLMGDATRMPFLAVPIGIPGGLQAMGLIGLFIGPLITMLFATPWREPQRMAGGVRQ